MHIVFVTSEMAGVFKLGGLADVCQSLPKALGELGHQVTILLPYYTDIDFAETTLLGEMHVMYSGVVEKVSVYSKQIDYPLVRILLFKHSKLENYHGAMMLDTFMFFSFVATSLCTDHRRFFSERIDIVHVHDWHTALVPVLLNSKKQSHEPKQQSNQYKIPTILTIHNLRYSGTLRDEKMKKIILDLDYWNDPGELNSIDILDRKNMPSLLREGLEYCDTITTVSPTYAKEISVLQEPPISDVLVRRNNAFFGILNGIDETIWNPKKDSFIQYTYDCNTVEVNKKKNKIVLQNLASFSTDDSYLLGFVGRIEPNQKGIDIIMHALSTIITDRKIQVVILGTGEDITEEILKQFEHKYFDKIRFINTFDDIFAHQIYAGCDALLVPSKYEPCGLTQLIAMRYGTLPIVRKTGGLADTVIDNETGFVFLDYSADALAQRIEESYDLWNNHSEKWATMVQLAMKSDFTWGKSAKSYVDLYTSLIDKQSIT